MNTAVYVILKGYSLVKIMCVVVHTKWITALFLSTLFAISQQRFLNCKEKISVCASKFPLVRIIFLKHEGSGAVFHCRSPPSDLDFTSQLKIEIGG